LGVFYTSSAEYIVWRAVEFTFSGFDEGSEVNGLGWAEVQKSRMAG
jgi:hypothetical protein